MAALMIPPVNPREMTIIDLDQGQQIIIDKDTHFGRVRDHLNDPNPTTAINIEPSGTCWSFTFEGGVWWRNEYIGDANRLPQLQSKVRATEEERLGREWARREWEERTRGSIPHNPRAPSYAQPHPSQYDPTPRMPSFDWQNEQRFPTSETADYVHIQQNAQTNSFPTPSFQTNTTNYPQNFGPPPIIPPQGWVPPQTPSFPPSFPFNSHHPSSSRSRSPPHGYPMPSSSGPPNPLYPSSWSSQYQMPGANVRINGGNFVQMDENTDNLYVNQPTLNVTGNNNNVNWIQ